MLSEANAGTLCTHTFPSRAFTNCSISAPSADWRLALSSSLLAFFTARHRFIRSSNLQHLHHRCLDHLSIGAYPLGQHHTPPRNRNWISGTFEGPSQAAFDRLYQT